MLVCLSEKLNPWKEEQHRKEPEDLSVERSIFHLQICCVILDKSLHLSESFVF